VDVDAIIVGGGAAGLFCARTAGLRGRTVIVLEHNARLGNKILISGGGRCNFTNIGATAANYVTSGSPNFVKSALARFTPAEFLALVERHGIQWHEKKLGQLFCDQSSKQILQLLEDECATAGVQIRLNCRIHSVHRHEVPEGAERTATWTVQTSLGEFRSSALVIASGGLSFPKLGTTPFGYEVARQFGIRVVEPRPGLVPLTWKPADLESFGPLSGLAIDSTVTLPSDAPRFRENVLFTHRGLSGPAILQISSHRRSDEPIRINLLPDSPALPLLESERRTGRDLKAIFRGRLPERLATAWIQRHGSPRPLAQIPQRDLETMARALEAWEIQPAGDEGYAKAEVTLGGIDTAELSSKNLESRKIPRLHFIGEVVDVTGWLGGYNFQWAWSSGHAAGNAL
jgi:predicted Rossmann fold flavoprotein